MRRWWRGNEVKMLQNGMELGGYLLVGWVESGGQAEVWRAKNRYGNEFAIKVLLKSKASEPVARARLLREAQLLGRLRRAPGMVKLIDARLEEERPYLVLDYLQGETLRKRLDESPQGRLSWHEVGRLGIDLCRVLAEIHRRGVLHRDIKPQNIFLARESLGEVAKLIDFGLASLVKEGKVPGEGREQLGTAGYMAPEQIRGEDIGPQADLYSLVAVLYEAAVGKALEVRPHGDGGVLLPFLRPRALCPELPEPLERVFLRCLALSPVERYQSAEELLYALQEVTGITDRFPAVTLSGALLTPSTDIPAVSAPTPRRPPGGVWRGLCGGFLVLLVVALWFGAFWFKDHYPDPRPRELPAVSAQSSGPPSTPCPKVSSRTSRSLHLWKSYPRRR